MLTFERIKLKNFLSVGNKPLDICLNDSQVTLIIGPNGSGKTLQLDAIFYALYGRSFRRVNIANMINSTNKKNLLVEIEFSSGQNTYKIVRGVKPNIFQIYINGVLKPELPNVKDYQNFLTNEILKIDEKTFRQLVVVGSTSYIPFMYLTAMERRTVIEDLLRIDIFSQMLQTSKSVAISLKNDTNEHTNKKNIVKTKIDACNQTSETLKSTLEKSIENINKNIADIETEIDKDKNDYETLSKSFDKELTVTITNEIKKLNSDIPQLSSLYAVKKSQLDANEKTKSFFEQNTYCPTCTQYINDELKLNKIEEYENKTNKNISDLSLFEAKLQELKQQKDDRTNKLKELKNIYTELTTLKTNAEKKIGSIKLLEGQKNNICNELKRTSEMTNDDISELEAEMKNLEEEIVNLNNETIALNHVMLLLKDDGVKKTIVKNHLVVINALIKKYLEIIGLNASFEFDENFNETLKMNNRDLYSYNNLSEGQKLRIDLAILFAFRELSKIRSSISTNILFLDEFSKGTLDAEGFEASKEIIKSCSSENIIIITHEYDQFRDIATKVIAVKKQGLFTEINTSYK